MADTSRAMYLCAFGHCSYLCYPGWPVCSYHAVHIHDTVRTWGDDVPPPQTTSQGEATKQAEQARLKKVRSQYGQIYYIRLNELIKIGWSSQLQIRLHDYTPGAELLVHYSGMRRDETNLHRTFAYCRVTGREWYDGNSQELNRHIAEMLEQHGPPRLPGRALHQASTDTTPQAPTDVDILDELNHRGLSRVTRPTGYER